ncbi:SDR family NAD(P)-dependent oxidoreductase [Polyangium sorediatum]|uniref:SDR family oxidoreductase n=1 Tax=Polyangium sorediatum TaxID=889274 RepID=A0ABT6NLL4_9BACT|nr:SDR family oxidoreductase [Polyangium sorediatum]MDI1429210.1 SDR family oxidoreductase [Polyangium sorediatum]
MARFLHGRMSRLSALAGLSVLGLSIGWLARRARAIRLEGKVAVVTGGSRGLGLLMAEELVRQGARLAICGRDAEAVERATRLLSRHGADVLGEARDLGNPAEAAAFVESVVSRFGRIDVLVNNAGVIQVAPLDMMDTAKVDEAMRSNFWSAAHMTFAAIPHLGPDARIVNVTSVGGRVPLPHMLGYTASKFAMVGFSEAIAAELRARGTKVTTVVPGPMRTGSFYNAEFLGRQKEEFAWFSVLSSLPLLSIDARVAAERIVRAAREGQREVHLGLVGRILPVLHGLAPRLFGLMATALARLLPPPGHSVERWRGREINSTLPGSRLLELGDRAARENNEEPPV